MHDEFIILSDDKNLGPGLMNREEKNSQCIKKYLSDPITNERISREVAFNFMKENIKEFLDFVKQPRLQLDNNDCKHL